MFCVWVGSSPPCSLPSFTPCSSPPFALWVVAAMLVAAVHAVGRRCWLLCAAGHVWLLSWLVVGVVDGFRGRAVCWSFEGSQLCSESLEGSWFSLSYRVGLGRVSPTPTADQKNKTNSAIFRLAAISAIATMAMAAAMAPPSSTRHATAIRWHFFRNPLRNSAMAAI